MILSQVLWTKAHIRLADVPGDGNCCIRSILSVLGEEGTSEEKVQQMRSDLSKYLSTTARSEPELLLAFFVLEGCDVRHEAPMPYVRPDNTFRSEPFIVIDSDDDVDLPFVV